MYAPGGVRRKNMHKLDWNFNLNEDITGLDFGGGRNQDILAAGTMTDLFFIDVEKKKLLSSLKIPPNSDFNRDSNYSYSCYYVLEWSPNGDYLLFNSGDWIAKLHYSSGTIQFLKIKKMKFIQIDNNQQAPAGQKIISWSPDSQFFSLIWDHRQNCLIFDTNLKLHSKTRNVYYDVDGMVSLSPIAWHPNGQKIVYALNYCAQPEEKVPPHYRQRDHRVFVFDLQRNEERALSYFGDIAMMRWDPLQEDRLLLATYFGNLDLFNIQTEKIEQSIPLSESPIVGICPLSPSPQLIFLTETGSLGLYDRKRASIEPIAQRHDLEDYRSWSFNVAKHPKRNMFATGFSGTIEFYEP